MDTPAACIKQAWMSELGFNCYTHNWQEAIEILFNNISYLTNRSEVLYIVNSPDFRIKHDNFNINILNLSIKDICSEIAGSESRIGAFVVNYDEMTPLILKKIRELASAEGALLIVNALKEEKPNEIAFKSVIPDGLICILDMTYCIADKFNLNPNTQERI